MSCCPISKRPLGILMTITGFEHQLKWLDLEAPRYTSYPSALHFKPLSSETYQHWLQQFDLENSVALYIHIPFCNQLCWFCGCHTKIANAYSLIHAYVQSLMKEMKLISHAVSGKIKLHSIHFGGGSPGILSADDLEDVFRILRSVFEVQTDAEVSIELDPRQLLNDKIQTYKRLGFNRVSLGIQDTNDTVQTAIHRIQPFEQVRESVERLRAEQIHDINIDLIYGLPFQTMESIEKTINQVCSLAPSRIAYYSFAHVPWIKKHQRLIFAKDLASVKDKGRMFLHASKLFKKNGYEPLGIDHFSKITDDCFTGLNQKNLRRNFMGYTTQPNDFVLGLGASAISYLGKGLSQNTVNDVVYKQNTEHGLWSATRGWVYTQEDYLRKVIINELMCYFFVDIEKILEQFNVPVNYFDEQLALLRQFSETDVMTITHRCINFHSPLRMIVRSVCAVFDQYHLTLETGRYLKIS